MKLFVFLMLIATQAFAINCDCEVRVSTPMTGSHQIPPRAIEKWEIFEFTTYSIKNQQRCKNLCQEKFEEEMPSKRLNALLINYGQSLIEEKVLGYNCTGLTTLKFPVRVKASLGKMGLGNVYDVIQVINHEELCF